MNNIYQYSNQQQKNIPNRIQKKKKFKKNLMRKKEDIENQLRMIKIFKTKNKEKGMIYFNIIMTFKDQIPQYIQFLQKYSIILFKQKMGNCSNNCQNVFNTCQNQLVHQNDAILNKSNNNCNLNHNIIQSKQNKHLEEENKNLENNSKDQFQKKLKRGSKKKKNLVNLDEQKIELYEKVNKLDDSILPDSFQKHFLFSQLNYQSKMSISTKMCRCTLDSEKFVFKQGDKASAYFIIKTGECELILQGNIKKILKQGDSFGELALLFGAKRSASIRCLKKCEFWMIDRNSFKKAVEKINQKNEKENREILKAIPFFQLLTEEQKQAVLNAVVTLTYQSGDEIIRKGDVANSYYIIKAGTAFVKREDGSELILHPGETFGEKSLTQSMVRTATIIAKSKCQVISIGKDTLTNVLGDAVTVIIKQNQIKIAFENSQYLRKLPKSEYNYLITKAIFKEVKKNEIISMAGKKLQKLYIIFQNKLSKNSVCIIQQQSFFQGIVLSKNIVAQKDGYIAEIEYQIKQEKIQRTQQIQDIITLKDIKENNLDLEELQLTNLFMIRKLGLGQYGQAFSVYSSKYRKLLAVKVLNKNFIEKNNLSKHLCNQETVLKILDSPYIMKYYKTMRDNFNIYFLLQLIDGKELFEVIRQIGILNSTQARFYVAQIMLALQYLHKNNIVYRDLKPENIMVQTDGYIKLIDVGTSKILTKSNRYRTNTIIGTPHYMAPETVNGKGYTFFVDLWSLGVCLYQFVSGKLPFCEQSEDPYEIYKSIIEQKDAKLKKFIDKLLSKIPEARIGFRYDALKRHEYFTGFIWQDLKNKKYVPDYQIKGSNENVLLEDSKKKTIKDYYLNEKKFDKVNKYMQKTYSWESLLNV